MKNYIYHSDGGDTRIEDRDTYIILEKKGQPMLKITKHDIYAMGRDAFVPFQRRKSENLVKNFRDKVIKEGLKSGDCEAV